MGSQRRPQRRRSWARIGLQAKWRWRQPSGAVLPASVILMRATSIGSSAKGRVATADSWLPQKALAQTRACRGSPHTPMNLMTCSATARGASSGM
jgi:hypothetical protein